MTRRSELYNKPLYGILDLHDNVSKAIRCRTHIQIELWFMKPALAHAIVVDNIADLGSCAWSLHNPVMSIKWKAKPESM